MKILYASPEVVPFAKTGGLADVAGALPKAIKELGHDIRIVLPKYQMVDAAKWGLNLVASGIAVTIGNSTETADVYESVIPDSDVPVYFIGNDKFFNRKELYTVAGKDYEDNAERFIFYCKAALEFLKQKGWRPDIVHCNDWQSAMMIAYIKLLNDPYFSKAATVYSVHNMAYQGMFPKEKFGLTGISWDHLNYHEMEAYGTFNVSKTGFVYADMISTVSETYGKEIQTKEYGCGLDALLRERSQDILGILNGIDYDLWDPAKDPAIPKKYSVNTISLKYDNKAALQRKNGLKEDPKIPLVGIVTRLADQKGLDIIAGAIEDIFSLGYQMVVLGTGEPKYHELLKKEKLKHPDSIGVNLGFDAALAQLIYAGCDMFLMPSRYEPCGLGQMISFKYGTVPIVRKTGGLADTVFEYDTETGEGNGFVFTDPTSKAFLDTMKRALAVYKDKKSWDSLVKKIMKLDFSWNSSAKKYISLYMKAIAKVGERLPARLAA